MRRAVAVSAAALCLFATSTLLGQGNANVDEVIARTESALNDLDYSRAATMARTLVELANGDKQVEIRGLQLLAASLYPEERGMQRPDSARAQLKRLIWTTPSAIIPRSISWPGLDSLLEETRRQTLAFWPSPESLYVLTGTAGRVPILVRGSRIAAYNVTATNIHGGAPVILDSIPASTGGRLSFSIIENDRVRLPSGTYELRITATDTVSGESATRRYEMAVEAEPIQFLLLPSPFPDDSLLPERSHPSRKRNALVGLGLGAVTGLLASTMKGDAGVGPASNDGRAWVVGATMSLGAVLGALTDHGRPLPANTLRNQEVRNDREREIRLAEQENARVRGSYSATVRILRELR